MHFHFSAIMFHCFPFEVAVWASCERYFFNTEHLHVPEFKAAEKVKQERNELYKQSRACKDGRVL